MLIELFASAVTLAASAHTPMPGTQAFKKPEVPWPIASGVADFGVKTTSDSYTDGHFSISAPIFSNIGASGTLGGSLLFIEPYISWGEQGEVATSLGFGFRHLFNNQPLSALQERHAGLLDEGVMVGGNLFLDMLDTQNDHRFWQLGFGVEFETRYFALRANYYQPLTGRQENEPILQRDIQRATFLTSGKEPFATGHTIQQDVTFTTYDFYTDRLYRTYEEGMKGWDAEAAVLVPGLDKWCELWLIGGYGDFRNKPFGPQIGGTGEMHGWKAGVEFRPIPQLVLSAMHFEEKRMQGGEWMYGLSLQLPLDPEPENQGKSWWRKIKDTIKPRSRHLAERTVVPVHRQNAAVKIANSISEPEVKTYAKVVSEEERRVVVRDDVIFVNNGGVQENGIAAHGAVEDGTAERPFDTIQEGVDLSSLPSHQLGQVVPTVFVAGSDIPYKQSPNTVRITNSVHLVSGGYGVPVFAGKVFGLGRPANVIASNAAVIGGDAFSANLYPENKATSVWIDGFDIVGNVRIERVTDFKLRSNRLNNLYLNESLDGVFNAVVSGNTFVTHADAVDIDVGTGDTATTTLNLLFKDNHIQMLGTGFGVGLSVRTNSSHTHTFMHLDGNTFSGATSASGLHPAILLQPVDNTTTFWLSSDQTNWIGGPGVGSIGISHQGVAGTLLINGFRVSFP